MTIGVLYYLQFAERINYYQSGFRYAPDGHPHEKPGLVAHTLAIRHFLEQGASEYDFLGGEPETVRYKRSLSTDSRTLAFQRFPTPGRRIGLIRKLRRLRRWIRST